MTVTFYSSSPRRRGTKGVNDEGCGGTEGGKAGLDSRPRPSLGFPPSRERRMEARRRRGTKGVNDEGCGGTEGGKAGLDSRPRPSLGFPPSRERRMEARRRRGTKGINDGGVYIKVKNGGTGAVNKLTW